MAPSEPISTMGVRADPDEGVALGPNAFPATQADSPTQKRKGRRREAVAGVQEQRFRELLQAGECVNAAVKESGIHPHRALRVVGELFDVLRTAA